MGDIYRHLINDIINSKLTHETINKFVGTYIKQLKYQIDRHYNRISNEPFSKWRNVKRPHIRYIYSTIIDAITIDDYGNLNKNQKVLANKIAIIK